MLVTLSPETTILTPRTMAQFVSTLYALKEHASSFWGCSEEVALQIELSKIDIATDMKGSFIPDQDEPCYNEIKE